MNMSLFKQDLTKEATLNAIKQNDQKESVDV